MMKKNLSQIFLLLIALQVTACDKNTSLGNTIESPKLIVSNPVPAVGEEITVYYESNISGNPKWTLGDGAASSDALVKHVYAKEGKYTIRLEFSDGKGGIGVSSVDIEVIGTSLTKELSVLAQNPDKVWICAHRGITREGTQKLIPENSIASIQETIDKGLDIIEIDIRETYDGHFVLMHDASIDRTTNGKGLVQNKTFNEIRSLKLRAQDGTVTNHGVPTLEEALLAGRGKVFFNLDLGGKRFNMANLVKIVDSLHMSDRVMYYIGTSSDMANDIVNADKKAILFPWAASNAAINSWAAVGNTKSVHLSHSNSDAADVIAYARSKNLPAFANALLEPDKKMLNGDFSEIDKMLNMNLNIIQTDCGDVLAGYLKTKNKR